MRFALVILTMGLFFSCDNDSNEVDEEITAADMSKIKSTVETGEWKITSYLDSESDETSEFVDYVFSFNNDGTLGVANGDVSVSGAWSLEDDDSEDNVDLNIFFATPPLFEEITEDWVIITYSSTKIELKNLDDSDDSFDYLTFEKI